MKQFTHAWLAFKAIERLEKADLGENRQNAMELTRWFWDHQDSVIRGTWYPDFYIKDNATSHVYKYAPADQGRTEFRSLPTGCLAAEAGTGSPVFHRPYRQTDPSHDLPERCEALARSILDSFKMQEIEEKGSSIAPTNNHIATLFFMLSHYLADAHMPLHCDSRRFSDGHDIHAKIEERWDVEVLKYYQLDRVNERFYYGPDQYPLHSKADDSGSFLKLVNEGIAARPFTSNYGPGNRDLRSYTQSITQHSYLLAFGLIPPGFDEKNVDGANWQKLDGRTIEFAAWSKIIFCDAADTIARVWLQIWIDYMSWKKERSAPKPAGKAPASIPAPKVDPVPPAQAVG